MAAKPNPKGIETKMDSSTLRAHLEEEKYSSAPESPEENNRREKSPFSPPPPLSPPPTTTRLSSGSSHESPVENNQREKSNSPPRPRVTFGSAHESPAENNQREKSSSPLTLPPPSKALVVADRYSNDHGSFPLLPTKELPPPEAQSQPQPQQRNVGVKPASPVVMVNRSMREEMGMVTKVDPGGVGDGGGVVDGFGHGTEDGVWDRGDRRSRGVPSILLRSKREAMVKRAALVIRVCEVVFCLVSFSVMGADKTRGWAGDSFDRYKEYRYCISVNIIGFVYAGFQAYDMAYHIITGKHVIRHPLRFHINFALDQMMTYLLISASSSAATRVDDWVSNWGKDEFTAMASASIAMSFLAFFSFGISSLISGYLLCTRNFT
ncbi:CASP-like protein 4A3 [Macadamia integrifolia]|uniref:CASP-like protein 4A3 n=1 Tax=Macadamia integrifolia TaxID=60698 RepID=UPI001C4FD1D3|nr:CASP-like protein 4A3 [Macadamia integrifolia]